MISDALGFQSKLMQNMIYCGSDDTQWACLILARAFIYS